MYCFQTYSPIGERGAQSELPNYYIGTFQKELKSNVNLDTFIDVLNKVSSDHTIISKKPNSKDEYDFITNSYYYTNHPMGENKWIGIVDRPDVSTHLIYTEDGDIFKIRPKRPKILDKKRASGLSTQMGSVCQTSIKRSKLDIIAKSIGVRDNVLIHEQKRVPICVEIYKRLQFLEKYGTDTGPITKFIYLIIPINHPSMVFPLNLVDRIEYIKKLFKIDFVSKIHTHEKKIITSYKVQGPTNLSPGEILPNIHLLKRYNLTYNDNKKNVSGIIF